MNKSIRKIHSILVESFNAVLVGVYSYNDKVNTAIISGQIAMWLENNRGMSKHRIYFDGIDMLSRLCEVDEYEYITPKDITEIVFYCLKRNLDVGILDNDSKITGVPLHAKFISKVFNPQTLLGSMMASSYYESYKTLNEALFLEVEVKEDTLYDLLDSKIDNLEFKRGQYALIKEYYFNRLNSYTEDDVSIVIEALKQLGINEESLSAIRETLIARIIKRQPKKDEIYVSKVKVTPQPKQLISKKERYAIEKELAEYFDFMKMEPLAERVLTTNEIAYCIGLLEKLEVSQNRINIFMHKSFKKAKEAVVDLNIIFNELQVKLQFYGIDNEDVKNSLETIRMFMPEYLLLRNSTENSEELKEWEEIIITELDNIKAYIPKDYQYEEAQILSLRNKSKEEA